MSPALSRSLRSIVRSGPGLVSLILLAITAGLALLAPVLPLPDPAAMDFELYQKPGADHWLIHQQPDAVARAVLDWLPDR